MLGYLLELNFVILNGGNLIPISIRVSCQKVFSCRKHQTPGVQLQDVGYSGLLRVVKMCSIRDHS